MGLTIHYHLKTTLTDVREVQALVASLHEAAVSLPFEQVGPVKEYRDREADFEQSGREDEGRWLKIQAGRHPELADHFITVKPLHIIAFTVRPGPGCEPANFGFCRYPAHTEVTAPGGRVRRRSTGLDGWSWGSFCKTQYASDPKCGGTENFLKCHVGLVTLLDWAAAAGRMTVEVDDESGYWQSRDPNRLVDTVGEWNQFVAAFAGSIQDLVGHSGVTIAAAITGFPNFEHLEAKGVDRLGRSGTGD